MEDAGDGGDGGGGGGVEGGVVKTEPNLGPVPQSGGNTTEGKIFIGGLTTYVNICVHVRVHVCMYVCMNVLCMRACMHVFMYTCMQSFLWSNIFLIAIALTFLVRPQRHH
jgi:hypothetical protein